VPLDADFLVVGSGIGGLWSALRAAEHGTVMLVTKKEHRESNTNYAQGGIAGVMDSGDSPDLHIQDTLEAGAGLCDREAVEILVREGPDRIRDLIALGTNFTRERTPEGEEVLSLGREGGHSRRRIVHAADLTGREIERALLDAVARHENLQTYENHLALELIVRDGECLGLYVLDRQTRLVKTLRSRAVILASGGAGQIYPHTTNPAIATGDGVAMAYRAGAKIADMEFIQFHPTSLCHPAADSFLISEAVRGEGGILRLADGSTFMEKYHELGDLAPRDVVARAIHAETIVRSEPCAFLDVTHLDPEKIKSHFPTIYARCLHFGIDMTEEWVPVVPAAHYSCGGVRADEHARTSIDRLYAVGEVSCTGVHGANRLASNSLLEAVVYAERAAANAAAWDRPPNADLPRPFTGGTKEPDTEYIDALRYRLHERMWKDVGIVRTNRSLARAERELAEVYREAEALYHETRLYGALIELRNMAAVALLVVRCARMRKESRGLHYNKDYPGLDPTGAHHSELDVFTSRLPGGTAD
jgi:L-aspartate oxidase